MTSNSMQPTTNTMDDPYETPFAWSDQMRAECGEDRLFGLLPCPWQCEAGGWLPTVEGEWVACPSCQKEINHGN